MLVSPIAFLFMFTESFWKIGIPHTMKTNICNLESSDEFQYNSLRLLFYIEHVAEDRIDWHIFVLQSLSRTFVC